MTSIKGEDIDFDAFQILSIEVRWISIIITTVVSRWGILSLVCLRLAYSLVTIWVRASSLAMISARVGWDSIGMDSGLLDSSSKYGLSLWVGMQCMRPRFNM